MSHRTSLEVQARCMSASSACDRASKLIYAAPGARNAEHLVTADYDMVRTMLEEAKEEIARAIKLIESADRVDFVNNDAEPVHSAPVGYVFNRRGERVAVSIPAKE